MENSKLLIQLEKEYEYFFRLSGILHDPRVYNGFAVPIENNISILEEILLQKKEEESIAKYAFELLGKYCLLKKTYLMNHPWKGLYNF